MPVGPMAPALPRPGSGGLGGLCLMPGALARGRRRSRQAFRRSLGASALACARTCRKPGSTSNRRAARGDGAGVRRAIPTNRERAEAWAARCIDVVSGGGSGPSRSCAGTVPKRLSRLQETAMRGVERVPGIEPGYSAWKAAALPLSYTRAARRIARGRMPCEGIPEKHLRAWVAWWGK